MDPILLIVCLFATLSLSASGAYVSKFQLKGTSWRRSFVKMTATAALIPISVFLDAPIFLTAGLMLSALADVTLSRDTDRSFLGGLSFSGASHVVYGLLFAQHWMMLTSPVVALLGLAGVGIGYLTLIWNATAGLRVPLTIYVAILVGVTFVAFGMPLNLGLAVAGWLLYLCSEILLGLEYFKLPKIHAVLRISGPVIWLCYYGSLCLMLFAFLNDAV